MPKRDNAPQFGAILIADDHEVVRFGLAEVLRTALGATRVIGVSGFDEAIKHLADPDLQLAIFDLRTSGLDTPRGLAVVRQRRPDLRVIVLSGSSARDDILAALEAGVHGYLVKSESADLLVQRVKYVLSGEIYVPPAIAELPRTNPAKNNGRSDVQTLTHRQLQVLELVTEGHSNKAIAAKLKISEGTVKMHIAATFRAIGATNRTQAAAIGKKLLD